MKQFFLPPLIIATASIALYGNTLWNGFVYDDYATIVNNGFIMDLHNLPKLFTNEYFLRSGELSYRPVVTLTFFADYHIFALKPWGYHLTNVLIHTANGLVLYMFLTMVIHKLGKGDSHAESTLTHPLRNIPLLISFLLTVHPILTEAVNAISFREDLLVFFFYINALNLYIFANEVKSLRPFQRRIAYTGSCLLYTIALFSKEMAMTLPLIICCYEWMRSGRKGLYWVLNRYGLIFVSITVGYCYLRFNLLYNPSEEGIVARSLPERLLALPSLIAYYVKLIIFPLQLTTQYVMEPVKSFFAPSFIIPFLIIIFFLLIVYAERKNRVITFGAFFFLISLMPVYNIIPIANPFAERYLYLPAIGGMMVIGSFFTSVGRYKNKVVLKPYISGTFFIIYLIYSIDTIKRNTAWKDDYSLWANTVSSRTGANRAYNNLGIAYAKQGNYNDAMRAFLTVLRRDPYDVMAHNNIGLIYYKKGMLEEAIKEFNIALKLNPSYSESHYNLGNLYLDKGSKEEAIKEFRKAIEASPDFLPARKSIDLLN